MNNDKEKYQLICDKLLERYELECSVIEMDEVGYIIYVKNFDIKCRIKTTLPIVYLAEYVASCCYKRIPKHYKAFIEIYTKKGGMRCCLIH